MNLTQLYKSLYEQEKEVRKYCESKLPFHFTILTTTATLIIFAINNILDNKKCFINYRYVIISIFMCISLIVFVLQIIFVFKTYFSFKYKYLEFPINKIEEKIRYRINIVSKRFTTKESLEKYISEYVDGMVCRLYMKCSSNNYLTNIKKRKSQHVLEILLYFNIIILVIIYISLLFYTK